MVGMWIALIAAGAVVVVALVVVVLRRPRSGDLSSVERYHSALGTIEQLAERTGRPTPRPVSPLDRADPNAAATVTEGQPGGPGWTDAPGAERPAPALRGQNVPPVPVRGRQGFPEPGQPLVFDDARPEDRAHAELAAPAPLHRVDRAQRHALESMNHRPRRATAVAAGVVVVLVVAALAVVGSRHSTTTTTGHGHTGTVAVSDTSSSAPATGHHSSHRTSGRHHRRTTTATTLPTQVVAVSSTGTTALYPVDSDSYTLGVKATGPCWVLATATATGATLWTGTLQAGADQAIPATGVVTVELGAPTVSLTLDGVPVTLPTPAHTPFVATFQPSTQTTTQTTQTTTTTQTTAQTTTAASSGVASPSTTTGG